MAFLTKPNPNDLELTGFSWQSWFRQVYDLLKGLEHIGGHWYLNNGGQHAITSSAGIQVTDMVATAAADTLIYSYQLNANELHNDQQITAFLAGALDSATGAETITLNIKFDGTLVRTLSLTPKNATNVGWKFSHIGTIRTAGASGTFIDYLYFDTDTESVSYGATATVAIDTTVPVLYEIYAQWGAAKAGNSLLCTQGSLSFSH